jgi:hypothetical protein
VTGATDVIRAPGESDAPDAKDARDATGTMGATGAPDVTGETRMTGSTAGRDGAVIDLNGTSRDGNKPVASGSVSKAPKVDVRMRCRTDALARPASLAATRPAVTTTVAFTTSDIAVDRDTASTRSMAVPLMTSPARRAPAQ